MRAYKDNRDNEMIGDAVGELQGKVIKGTLTKDNAGKSNNWYNNVEKKIPEATGEQWYVKKDVIGMPSYQQQKSRGTPRVIVLVDGAVPQDTAWFSTHYESFEALDAGFFKRGATWKTYFSK
jgi:hypothetical protein